MYIYKITNTLNNKVYIGQTIHSVEERWKRHQNDALSGRLNTHFAQALRKYPIENFIVETIDTATSQEELTEKEYYWINYYNSLIDGYNSTNDKHKCGGNTYQNKTKEEMQIIKEKISNGKLGSKNPNARKVKCKNVETNEEFHFDSQAEMRDFFNETNHVFISKRCLGKIKSLYKGIWQIAFEENEYNEEATPYKNNYRAKRVLVKNLETNEEKEFHSYKAAEDYFRLNPKQLSGKAYKYGKTFTVLKKFQVTKMDE